MIYELRTSTVRQRSLSEAIKAVGTVSLDIRKDNYGKLEGCWQTEIGRVVRDELKRLGRKHLVFASQAFSYTPKFTQPLDATFTGSLADAANVHPLPDTVLGGRAYMLGNFMSKELTLAELAEFCRATQKYPKPCVLDEDNAATLYRDPVGWTIHRKRAWVALLSFIQDGLRQVRREQMQVMPTVVG